MKIRMKISCAVVIIFFASSIACSPTSNNNTAISASENDSSGNKKTLQVTYVYPNPVITVKSKGAEGIKFGFEGGRVVKINGVYHLFTSELYQDPIWVKMRLGYWTSRDKVNWKRVATIRESSGEYTGKDPRASLWSPLPVWDEDNNEWNLFYVAYKAAPDTPERFLMNHEGKIWRAVSKTKGLDGISGPYEDISIILEPGTESQSWEGLQGTDSFFPWKVGKAWYALYGSAKTEIKPVEFWRVGFASAAGLAGPWKRMAETNPANIEKVFIENPIVTPAPGGGWIVVYDHQKEGAIGWAYSGDGLNWPEGSSLDIVSSQNDWCKNVRTPMGLIDEGNGKLTVFYTGFQSQPDYDQLMAGKAQSTLAIGYIELEFK